jgi:hypothetical protein
LRKSSKENRDRFDAQIELLSEFFQFEYRDLASSLGYKTFTIEVLRTLMAVCDPDGHFTYFDFHHWEGFATRDMVSFFEPQVDYLATLSRPEHEEEARRVIRCGVVVLKGAS